MPTSDLVVAADNTTQNVLTFEAPNRNDKLKVRKIQKMCRPRYFEVRIEIQRANQIDSDEAARNLNPCCLQFQLFSVLPLQRLQVPHTTILLHCLYREDRV